MSSGLSSEWPPATQVRWDVRPSSGQLDAEGLEGLLLKPRTRLLCLTQRANVTGSIELVSQWVKRLHEAGVLALIDGVAYAPNRQVDVQKISADFYVLSLYKDLPECVLAGCQQPALSGCAGQPHADWPCTRPHCGGVVHAEVDRLLHALTSSAV